MKIATGVHVLQRLRKTAGGLVRATLEVKDERIVSASISGDFFFYPESRLVDLEQRLTGQRLDDVDAIVAAFYSDESVESPGLTPAELAAILQGAG